jgi:chromosome condensin MukBEF ATPase and DNA-binding subunit MukB
MGWFNKDKEGEIPELPKLPELPRINTQNIQNERLPQLPSIPSSELGNKFSQNIIKEAVTGEKEEEEDADEEIPSWEINQMKQKPLTREINTMQTIPSLNKNYPVFSRKKEEPIFIRIDKFEESLKIFEKTKERIQEMEKMLQDIRRIKEEEESELQIWEQEIQNLKNQIEKVDQDIFSKVE